MRAAAPAGLAGLREEFPALEESVEGKRLVYLDSACTALKPRAVAERLSEFYLRWGGCGGKRSTHLASQKVEAWLHGARRCVAGFLGAESPDEIVFTSGTTEAANLVARALPCQGTRREVVISDLEHNAVFLPFHEAAARGELELRICRSKDGRVDLDKLESMVSERTALVAVTRASNVMGGVQPLADVVRLAHRKGALVFADDAQYVSSHKEDVRALNVDFAAFSSHKVGGPFGVGVLYGKSHQLNGLGCYKVGGGTVKSVEWDGGGRPEVRYLDAPARFEPGVPDFGGVLGLEEAIKFLSAVPAPALRAHIRGLVERLAAGLARHPEIAVLGRPQDLAEGSLVSFRPVHEDFSPADFNLFLNHEQAGRFFAVRVGEHCAHLLHQSLGLASTVRVSFFAYNTTEEVDLFLDALEAYLKAACR